MTLRVVILVVIELQSLNLASKQIMTTSRFSKPFFFAYCVSVLRWFDSVSSINLSPSLKAYSKMEPPPSLLFAPTIVEFLKGFFLIVREAFLLRSFAVRGYIWLNCSAYFKSEISSSHLAIFLRNAYALRSSFISGELVRLSCAVYDTFSQRSSHEMGL